MEFRSNQSIYLQIADLFIDNILKNKWAEEERVPSVRELAMQLEVNPNTVVRTYNYLQKKDIIHNRRGIGYFVSLGGSQKARDLKKQEFIQNDVPVFFRKMEILNLNINEVHQIYKEQKTKQ